MRTFGLPGLRGGVAPVAEGPIPCESSSDVGEGDTEAKQ
jgi:hypothetical protein